MEIRRSSQYPASREYEPPEKERSAGSTHALHMSWHSQAACAEADPDIFFPDLPQGRNAPEKVKEMLDLAKEYCDRCEVRVSCDEYASGTERNGIWAGRLLNPPSNKAKPRLE